MTSTFHAIDRAIVVAYLVAMTAVGAFFTCRRLNLVDLFRAPVDGVAAGGLSLMAALNSGIDYLMQPASTIKYGLIHSEHPDPVLL